MDVSQPLALRHEGADLQGQVFVPAGRGPHPALLVMSNAHGLGRQARSVATELAERGWLAIATDMYGGGAFHEEPREAGKWIGPLWENPSVLRARVIAWFDAMRERPDVDPTRLAAIGYCFGGQCVLELARAGADVRAVVSYHGVLKTHERARHGEVKARVAIYTGGRDPYVPHADLDAVRAELSDADADFSLTEFARAEHSFTDPDAGDLPGMGYDAAAHRVSWAGTLALLDAIA